MRRFWLPSIIGIIILGFVGFLWNRSKPIFFAPSVVKDSSRSLESQPESPKARIIQRAMEPGIIDGNSLSLLSSECKKSWTDLVKSDVSATLQSSGVEGELSSALDASAQCALPNTFPPRLLAQHERVQSACKDFQQAGLAQAAGKVSEKDWRVRTSPCILESLVYRSLIQDFSKRNTPTDELNDQRALTDRLISKLADGDNHQVIEVVDKLRKVSPELEELERARAMSYMSVAQEEVEKNGTLSSVTAAKLEDAIQLAKANTPSLGRDDELTKAELYASYLKDRNADRLYGRAMKAREENPRSGIPEHFLAIAAFEKGNRNEAIEHLRTYARISGDEGVMSTITRIQQGDTAPFEIAFKQAIEILQVPVRD